MEAEMARPKKAETTKKPVKAVKVATVKKAAEPILAVDRDLKKYRTLNVVTKDGRGIPAGTEIELSSSEAARLLKLGAIEEI